MAASLISAGRRLTVSPASIVARRAPAARWHETLKLAQTRHDESVLRGLNAAALLLGVTGCGLMVGGLHVASAAERRGFELANSACTLALLAILCAHHQRAARAAAAESPSAASSSWREGSGARRASSARLALVLLLCAFYPFPGADLGTAGLLMLLRLPFLAARVLFDRSLVWQTRSELQRLLRGDAAATSHNSREQNDLATRTLLAWLITPAVAAPLLLLVAAVTAYCWAVVEAAGAAIDA